MRLLNQSFHVPVWWRGEPSSPKLRKSATLPSRGSIGSCHTRPCTPPGQVGFSPKRERRGGRKERTESPLEPKLAYVEVDPHQVLDGVGELSLRSLFMEDHFQVYRERASGSEHQVEQDHKERREGVDLNNSAWIRGKQRFYLAVP